MLCCTVAWTVAAVASLTALIIFSSRGAAALDRLADKVVVEAEPVTSDAVGATTGAVDVLVIVIGSVAAGAVVRAASASENPAQVGLLSGLVEH